MVDGVVFPYVFGKLADWLLSLPDGLHKRVRLYVYGAGRVGKSTLIQSFINMIEPVPRDLGPNPADEKGKIEYIGFLNPQNPALKNVILEIYSYGGQLDKAEQRGKHFCQIDPMVVIFMASPFIVYDPFEHKGFKTFKIEDKQYIDVDLAIERNKLLIGELVSLFNRNTNKLRSCQYLLPVISHKDLWGEVQYIPKFNRELLPLFNELSSHHGIKVNNSWVGYGINTSNEWLNIFKNAVEASPKNIAPGVHP